MEVTRGRKLPGSELILSDTFQVTLTEADLTEDEKKHEVKVKLKLLIWRAELALFTQILTSGLVAESEKAMWEAQLIKMKGDLGIEEKKKE